MRFAFLGLVSSISIASLICLYCLYVVGTALFIEFNYAFELDSRAPSLLPMTAILQWYNPYLNKSEQALGRYAAFGPVIDIDYNPDKVGHENQNENPHEKIKTSFEVVDNQPSHFFKSVKRFVYTHILHPYHNKLTDDDSETPDQSDNIFKGNLVHITDDACDYDALVESLADSPFYNATTKKFCSNDTIVLNERGGCSFYTKILNLQKQGTKAVVIGNDQFNRGLLTMFSKNIPENIVIPSIFVTKETLIDLQSLIYGAHSQILPIEIFTGQTPSPFLDALLTLVFSPPIALSIVYFIIKFRNYHKRRLEKASKNVVKSLPVFVYNEDYLIPINDFEKRRDFYVNGRDDFDQPKKSSNMLLNLFKKSDTKSGKASLEDSESCDTEANLSQPSIHRHLSIEELNQYQMNQCTICLNTFRKLKSKVILLPCNHYFHYKCCINWLCNYHKICPICKHDITKKSKVARRSVDSNTSSFTRSSILNIFNINHGSEESMRLMVDRGTSPGLHSLGQSPSNYSSIPINGGVSSSAGMSANNVGSSTSATQFDSSAIDDSTSDISSNDVDYLEREAERRNSQNIETNENGLNDEEQSIENLDFY